MKRRKAVNPSGPPRYPSIESVVRAAKVGPSLHELGQHPLMKQKPRYVQRKAVERKITPTGPPVYTSLENQVRVSKNIRRIMQLNRISGETKNDWIKRTTNIKFLKEVFPNSSIEHIRQIAKNRKKELKSQ